jgi:hypothetical protein
LANTAAGEGIASWDRRFPQHADMDLRFHYERSAKENNQDTENKTVILLLLYIAYTHICIMLHLLNKSAFILLLETADSVRVFCVFVSIYIYMYIGAGFL